MPSGSAALLVVLGLGRVLADEGEVHDASRAVPTTTSEILLVTDPVEVLGHPPATTVLKRAKWIRHRVRPRERVTQIAARYGVKSEDIIEWNALDLGAKYPKGRRTLRVLARRIPPPRRKIRYIVGEDEGWMDVAAKFRIERRDLRAYNWRIRRLEPGTELKLWIDPGYPRTIRSPAAPKRSGDRVAHEIEAVDIPAAGRSVGRPQRGRLVDGVQLPDSELYTRKHPAVVWGSTHTVTQIVRAFTAFRRDTGYAREVVIGAMSRKHGRRFPPHVSHQSGRDIDIRLPLLPGVPPTVYPNPDEIDWAAAWALIKAFVETGEVSVIFLEIDLQSRLYEAARSLGESPETLRPIISWPNWKENTRPIVRHADGHDGHIHVRIACGPEEPRCKGR